LTGHIKHPSILPCDHDDLRKGHGGGGWW
jgi:hypothetical protein